MPEQIKRNIAYKFKIGDLLMGKPVTDGERFSFLDLGDKRIVRVNLIGNIIDKYESAGDRKYVFFTLDDGSGQIKLKSFGDDVEKVKDAGQGQTVAVIGVLRYFNNEVYVAPEIIRETDPKYLLIRKLELQGQAPAEVPKEKIFAVKDVVLELIKNSEPEGGIESDKIIMNPDLKNATPDIINQEIRKLLEEGIIFEPRPGKVRWLG